MVSRRKHRKDQQPPPTSVHSRATEMISPQYDVVGDEVDPAAIGHIEPLIAIHILPHICGKTIIVH